MFNKIIQALWGDLKGEELKKFILLALGFFFIIGSFWPLKTLKGSIFVNLVGPEHIPSVKILSLLFCFPLVLGYSKLIDLFSKQKMVYLLISFYIITGLIFVYYFYHPTIGLTNIKTDSSRALGWLFFLYVDSYISLILTLYWSYANDITTPESAKRGYGLIIFGTQLGGFLFTLVGNRLSADTTRFASRVPIIVLISIAMFFLIALVTLVLQMTVSKEDLEGYQEKLNIKESDKKAIGFLEGLTILLTHHYVLGIFGMIFFHEFISTIMDYQMNVVIKATYFDPGIVNKILFDYALAVQGIACLFGLFGTSFFQRKFGIKFCIIIYPILLGSSILFYFFVPTLQSIFYVMLIAKAINYAFNQPAKEVLYIPTSKDIKYKSKVWIDMFGLRLAKGSGSFANKIFGALTNASAPAIFCFVGLWLLLARTIGNKFNKAISKNELIE